MADENTFQKRQTAYWMPVGELTDGIFTKGDDGTHYKTKEGIIISRVNVVGVVLSKETADFVESITIEDWTGKISVKSFDKKDFFDNVEVENMVNIVGKIREYNGVPFISAEIITKVGQDMLSLRKKELPLIKKFYKKEESMPQTEEIKINSDADKLVEKIRELDSGEGVDIDVLVEKSGIKNAGQLVQELIHNGDVFEIMPGKLKILD